MATLVLIHTSSVFLTRETAIQDHLKELLPNTRIVNIMDDSLLPDVMEAGAVTAATTARMCGYVQAAETMGAAAVLSLCSSLGPAVDVARRMTAIPVIKIDDAHTAEAVRLGRRIAVLATVASTLGPTVALLEEKAAEAGKKVKITPFLSEQGFQALMRGDRDAHDNAVSDAAATAARTNDVLLLAQGSMARLAPRIAELTRKPVLSSPRLAVEHVRSVLEGTEASGKRKAG
ncbi:MAG TPA: aspartate/glutamate racemase family protein [Bryobacteraceae bacterium]|nr:aspartate/glutamate racemase family protein [Bryobacteraceae bacterium]